MSGHRRAARPRVSKKTYGLIGIHKDADHLVVAWPRITHEPASIS